MSGHVMTLPVLEPFQVDGAEAPEGDGSPQRPTASPQVQPHFMLVPSLACPAECSYCFGPHQGPIMSPATMEAALDFVAKIAEETNQRKVKVTFHGGESLQAGHEIWRQALEGLSRRLGRGRLEVGLQSNLWPLDDEFCRLLAEHKVEIGTRLDGPEAINGRRTRTGALTTRGGRLFPSPSQAAGRTFPQAVLSAPQ